MKTTNRPACPHCNNLLVEPIGPPNAQLLLVGDYPDYEDVRLGRCLSGSMDDYRMNPRKVLFAELVKVGIQLSGCRYTNLWSHGKNDKECKLEYHIDRVAKEIKGKKYVLLMGTDASRAFIGVSSTEVYGLKFKLKMFPGTVFVVSPNPTSLITGNVGEFRLALERLKKEMK